MSAFRTTEISERGLESSLHPPLHSTETAETRSALSTLFNFGVEGARTTCESLGGGSETALSDALRCWSNPHLYGSSDFRCWQAGRGVRTTYQHQGQRLRLQGFLGLVFYQPVTDPKVFFHLTAFVPVLVGFVGTTVDVPEVMFGVSDQLGQYLRSFAHNFILSPFGNSAVA